jgi:adenosylcobinamide hydrolase
MLLATLSGNDRVHHYKKSVVIFFGGKRRVISTAPHNGGYREDLLCVFNHDGKIPGRSPCAMKAPTYAQHMAVIAKEIGLDPDTACGISTAADMENMVIKSERYDDIEVTALATGGIDVNGGRAGDPASWIEEKTRAAARKNAMLGTINIMLHFNIDLTEGALTRAIVTCTEAKTAAVQELMLPSRYSRGLATGSGTDGVIIVSNYESDFQYENTGKHSKLGELIGRTVKAAVKETLAKQCETTPERQHSVMRRVDRFGVTEESLWEEFGGETQKRLSRAEFSDRLYNFSKEGMTVTYTSLLAHLIDQFDWGLISAEETVEASREVFRLMDMEFACESSAEKEALIKDLTGSFRRGVLTKVGRA